MTDPSKVRKEDDSDNEECVVEDMGSDADAVSDEEMEVNEEVQVDFEGFALSDEDFDGIRQMLHQLFPKENIDVSELSNLLIAQNFIGTVLKQGDLEEDDSEDSDDMDQVFGVTSCLSCHGMSKPSPAMNTLTKFLREKCDFYAKDDKAKSEFLKLLQPSKESSIGWIINERFINIPPQVALPMLEKLTSELEEALKRNHKTNYDFTHFFIICKTYDEQAKAGGEAKEFSPGSLRFINSEEELFFDECVASFTYPVDGASGLMSGRWNEDSPEMTPCRTVLLLGKEEVTKTMSKLRETLSMPTK